MSRPCIERGALLNRPIVPLIDPSNSAAATTNMIQNGFRHFEAYTKPLQAGSDGATQIVHAPWSERRRSRAGRQAGFAGIHDCFVESPLSLRPTRKQCAYRTGKHRPVPAPAPILRLVWQHGPEQVARQRTEWYSVRSAIFCALAR